jgi:hypothetical protein
MACKVKALRLETSKLCLDKRSLILGTSNSTGGYACGTSQSISIAEYPICEINVIDRSNENFLNALLLNANFIVNNKALLDTVSIASGQGTILRSFQYLFYSLSFKFIFTLKKNCAHLDFKFASLFSQGLKFHLHLYLNC